MNVPNIIDKIKCLVPLDDDGKNGEWWLHHKIDGRYKYTHDHLGDASQHLDRLQDEFWKLRDTAIHLANAAMLSADLVNAARSLDMAIGGVEIHGISTSSDGVLRAKNVVLCKRMLQDAIAAYGKESNPKADPAAVVGGSASSELLGATNHNKPKEI